MRTVNISVTHQDNAAIAQLRHVEVLAHAYPYSRDDIFHLFIGEHLIEPGTLDVEYFTTQGQDGLEAAVTALLRTPARAVSFHKVEFAAVGASLRAVGELAG